MGLFLMIPRLLLSVLKSPVNDIRKYIISSIINIVIKNNNIQDIIGVIAAAILTINLVYLGTRLARIFGKK